MEGSENAGPKYISRDHGKELWPRDDDMETSLDGFSKGVAGMNLHDRFALQGEPEDSCSFLGFKQARYSV